MYIRSRVLGAATLAVALMVIGGTDAQATQGAGGDIIFRLILHGDVTEGDAFTLSVNELTANPSIISPGTRCGPGSEVYNSTFVPCRSGVSIDFVLLGRNERPIGTRLEYVWTRYRPQDDTSATIYSATITVTENAQVFTVVYDYGGGQPLPNTAMRTPGDNLPLGVVAIISSMALGGVVFRRLRRTG